MTRTGKAPALRDAVSGLPAYIAGRRAETALTAALASNESHYDPLPSVLDAVHSAAGRMNRYPDMASTDLRTRLARHLEITPDQVVVGPGSVGVLSQIIASVCNEGDEVIFAWRSFEAYPILVTLAGACPVPVPLRPDEGHDLDAMAAAITDKTSLIILCSPNNPTGVAITPSELEDFLSRVPSDVLVVVDEAYVEYAAGSQKLDSLSVYAEHSNVCILRTFSKAYGLAGLGSATRLRCPILRRDSAGQPSRTRSAPWPRTPRSVPSMPPMKCMSESPKSWQNEPV